MVTKKDEIIVVARELFTQYGFNKTTMSDIAEAAGISKASLYYYFTNKTDVFASVYNTMAAVADNELQQTLNSMSTAADRIIACFENWGAHQEQVRLIGFYNLNPQLGAEFMPIIKAVWESRLVTLQNIINEGQAQKEILPLNSAAIARMILNSVIGIVCNLSTSTPEQYASVTPEDIARADASVRFFLTALLRGVSVEPVASPSFPHL